MKSSAPKRPLAPKPTRLAMIRGSHALQRRSLAGLGPESGEKSLKPEGLAYATRDTPSAKTTKPRRVLLVRLTEEELYWIAEISASVLRNRQLRRIPENWRELPQWWKRNEAYSIVPRALVTAEDVEDTRIAIAVLSSLSNGLPVTRKT